MDVETVTKVCKGAESALYDLSSSLTTIGFCFLIGIIAAAFIYAHAKFSLCHKCKQEKDEGVII